MAARILLVDDEPHVASVLKASLKLKGHEVDAFTDPEAQSRFKPDYYDILLLLDFKMPQTSGFELAAELHNLDSKPRICLMTAFEYSISEAQSRLATLRVDALIRKPTRIDEIVRVVEDTLERRRS